MPFDAAVLAVIVATALASLHFFYARGLTNIYGDAMAHMEGARRLTDSLTPGYPEIGSVWLPLFHLLVAPLAVNDHLWRTGLGGSLVSTAVFAASAWLVFRLAFEMNRSAAAGCAALAGFLFCPNLLYTASTPLTEPLAIFCAVATVYFLFRFQQSGRQRALVAAALAAFFGTLARYDGWYLLPFAALFVLWASRPPWRRRVGSAILFSVIAGTGPVLWIAHNWHRFGNPIEFYNGRYSAQAIYAHQLATTGFRYPTDGSFVMSARYYLEDLKLVAGGWLLVLAALGLVAWVVVASERRRRAAGLLLLVPLPFYVQSMAHSAVPLYVPTLFPHTYYNLRYGLEMLPALAVFPGFLFGPRLPRRLGLAVLAVLVVIIAGQDLAMVSRGARQLVVVEEGILNSPCRSQNEQAIIQYLRENYAGETIIMAAGKYPCVMPEVGISYRKTLTETNRRYWRRLPSGAAPWAAWIIRGRGDTVDEMMRAYPDAFKDFGVVAHYHFEGEDEIWIYRKREG